MKYFYIYIPAYVQEWAAQLIIFIINIQFEID